MKNAGKIIGIICVVGCFASFFFGISFYYRDFPDKPQPEFGRTHPINNHGFLLYLTKREELEQTLSLALAGVLVVSAGIIDRFVDPFDRRKQEVMPKKLTPWNHRRGP
jgi:hypothetical protein